MYTHAPADYDCPFCEVIAGTDNPYPFTQQSDVICRGEHATAFVTTHWWPNNPGHALVIPNQHIENIYTLPAELAMHIHEMARQIALAMKQAFACDGVSTRQHNEPAGNQHVWHYHLHVVPRFTGDRFYLLPREYRRTTPDERLPYAERLRAAMPPPAQGT